MNGSIKLTQEQFHQRLDDAYLKLDAAMPTILNTVEHLGDTVEARTFWLVQNALEDVHAQLRVLSASHALRA